MDGNTLFIFTLIYLSNLTCTAVCGSQPKTITGLRQFNIEAVVGRFSVNRIALEEELENRKQKDPVFGRDVNLRLQESLPGANTGQSCQGEIELVYGTITDVGLEAELSQDLKDSIATTYQYFEVDIPVIFGNDRHVILSHHAFIASSKIAIHPFYPSMNEITKVDSIVEAEDGIVTIRLRNDTIIIQVQKNCVCNDGLEVGTDFDELSGDDLTFSSYPLSFDWGCETFSSLSFCQALNEARYELKAVGGDICTIMSPHSSQRCPTTFKIIEMTGKFQEILPFLVEAVPLDSFEAEYLNREHNSGITYPC